ncbi:MAG: hypothetical protein SLAVMIC_00042 [uncultured marine phage]|uniref:Uncharacterized protein n=1 Tax=uncultured marine phage TaxID=707152 RepID=A0A8D9FQR2_9VIRU|nr:MAG: hypothetical protein SLAVMIC_00042 [uncultured marine phage]
MGKFKEGDRIIVKTIYRPGMGNMRSNLLDKKGVIKMSPINYNSMDVYEVTLDIPNSEYFHFYDKEIELDLQWYREERLKKILDE